MAETITEESTETISRTASIENLLFREGDLVKHASPVTATDKGHISISSDALTICIAFDSYESLRYNMITGMRYVSPDAIGIVVELRPVRPNSYACKVLWEEVELWVRQNSLKPVYWSSENGEI